jgi:hypothetical protein
MSLSHDIGFIHSISTIDQFVGYMYSLSISLLSIVPMQLTGQRHFHRWNFHCRMMSPNAHGTHDRHLHFVFSSLNLIIIRMWGLLSISARHKKRPNYSCCFFFRYVGTRGMTKSHAVLSDQILLACCQRTSRYRNHFIQFRNYIHSFKSRYHYWATCIARFHSFDRSYVC